MTRNTFDAVLQKAATDAEFRRQLAADPDAALALYGDQLDPDEKEELKSISSGVLDSISRLNEASPSRKWYRPGSFKELGGTLLSAVLLLLLIIVAMQAFGAVDSQPQTVQIGEQFHIVDPFQRSKDLLILFFPLFSAVVTFWLGVAVEGRRADKNEADANQARRDEQQARQDQMVAEAEALGTKATARAALSQAKSATEYAKSVRREGVQQPTPEGGFRRDTPSMGTAGLDLFDSILLAIESAEQQLQ